MCKDRVKCAKVLGSRPTEVDLGCHVICTQSVMKYDLNPVTTVDRSELILISVDQLDYWVKLERKQKLTFNMLYFLSRYWQHIVLRMLIC